MNQLLLKFTVLLIAIWYSVYQIVVYKNYYGLISLTLPVISVRNLLSLKNYFIIFSILLFGVGGSFFFPERSDLIYDYYAILISFLLGYYLFLFFKKKKKTIAGISYKKFKPIRILYFFILIDIMQYLYTIYSIGFHEFYSGLSLVDQIKNYGHGGYSKGLTIIINAIYYSVQFSFVILYLLYTNKNKNKINYKTLSVILILFPLLTMNRSHVLVGLLLLLFITYYFNREKIKLKYVVFIFIFILFIASYIGNIRQSALNDSSTHTFNINIMQTMIVGEFSSIIAYTEIKDNINILDYQYGKTIFLPLLFKVIPRSIYHDKPLNSSGYFMYMLHPNEASAGFFLAPTIFGDLYLNFGDFSIFFIFLLGLFSSYVDCSIKEKNISSFPVQIIVFYMYYSLLRNNLSGSIFNFLMVYITFKVIFNFFKQKNVYRWVSNENTN